ncbi:hypothetical protein BJY52DRAFT_947900 [Lactarius psammicola]|nr:hypothetical protein BJY52DRAFT_947900 [Lactarius psammicola]
MEQSQCISNPPAGSIALGPLELAYPSAPQRRICSPSSRTSRSRSTTNSPGAPPRRTRAGRTCSCCRASSGSSRTSPRTACPSPSRPAPCDATTSARRRTCSTSLRDSGATSCAAIMAWSAENHSRTSSSWLRAGGPNEDDGAAGVGGAEHAETVRGLVIEDVIPGVEAGKRAGMSVVWVLDENPLSVGRSQTQPDQTLRSLEYFVPEEWGLPPFTTTEQSETKV